jgi:hypothetical protein
MRKNHRNLSFLWEKHIVKNLADLQGDPIEQLFTYFEQFFENYKRTYISSIGTLGGCFFPRQKLWINLDDNRLGYIWAIFSQTHLVTLLLFTLDRVILQRSTKSPFTAQNGIS